MCCHRSKSGGDVCKCCDGQSQSDDELHHHSYSCDVTTLTPTFSTISTACDLFFENITDEKDTKNYKNYKMDVTMVFRDDNYIF